MKELFRTDKFDGGFTDAFGRGKAPANTFLDSRNLIPTKIGSLETPHGFSTTGGLSSLPTGVVKPGTDTNDVFVNTKMVGDPFSYSVEIPISYDGRVYFFEDANGIKHVALNTWFKGSTTPITSSVLYLDERKAFLSDDVTLGTAYMDVADAVTNGLSAVDGYYIGWRLKQDYSGNIKYAFVTNYVYNGGSGVARITVNYDISALWAPPAGGVTYTLQRFFHSHSDMVPTFDTIPGQTWEANGRIRGCGGASSSQHKFPWIAQYIKRTWFTGNADPVSFEGTYADQMECAGETVVAEAVASVPALPFNFDVTADNTFPDSRYYGIGWTLEYDGYEESRLMGSGTAGEFDFSISTGTGNAYTTCEYELAINFATMSKRVTAINVYVKEQINGINGQAYFLKRFDLVNPTAAEANAATGWALDPNTGTYAIDSTKTTARFTYDDYLNAGDTYYERTGVYQEAENDRHIIAWKYTEVVSGRRFFANFYDPNLLETVTDQVRFTPIAPSGASNYDVIPFDRINYEIDVASGNSEVVRGLSEDNGWLIIFKDNSIFSWYIGPDIATWVQHKVSSADGLYASQSIVKLPDGRIGFADVDAYKILENQRVVSLTTLWADTYYALSDKANIRAWYDRIDRSIRFTNGANITGFIYCCYPEFKYAWYKILHPPLHYVEFVCTERDGTVLFTNQSTPFVGLFAWHKTDYTYGAANYITPYLKTHEIVVDETALALVDKFMVVSAKRGNGVGVYTNNAYIDGTLVLSLAATTWPSQSVSYANLMQKLPVDANIRMGRKVQFEWNIVPYIGQYATTDHIQLDAIVAFGELQMPRNQSR